MCPSQMVCYRVEGDRVKLLFSHRRRVQPESRRDVYGPRTIGAGPHLPPQRSITSRRGSRFRIFALSRLSWPISSVKNRRISHKSDLSEGQNTGRSGAYGGPTRPAPSDRLDPTASSSGPLATRRFQRQSATV